VRRRIVEGLKRGDGYNRRLIPTRQPTIEDTMSDNSHEEDHTGPIKTPKQLLMTVFFSFVAPVFIIIGLVYFVVSGNKPAAGVPATWRRRSPSASRRSAPSRSAMPTAN
jgi:hypothetical protein